MQDEALVDMRGGSGDEAGLRWAVNIVEIPCEHRQAVDVTVERLSDPVEFLDGRLPERRVREVKGACDVARIRKGDGHGVVIREVVVGDQPELGSVPVLHPPVPPSTVQLSQGSRNHLDSMARSPPASANWRVAAAELEIASMVARPSNARAWHSATSDTGTSERQQPYEGRLTLLRPEPSLSPGSRLDPRRRLRERTEPHRHRPCTQMHGAVEHHAGPLVEVDKLDAMFIARKHPSPGSSLVAVQSRYLLTIDPHDQGPDGSGTETPPRPPSMNNKVASPTNR